MEPDVHTLSSEHLPALFWKKYEQGAGTTPPEDGAVSLKEQLLAYERRLVLDALRRHDGNITHAANALHTSRQHLYARIREMDL
jgi:arginine utilization regulatory protein